MPKLTANFTVNELSVTNYPFYNVPGPVDELYLYLLASIVLEPFRTLCDCPLACSSGYRSHAVNAAAGGKPDSQHLKGQAADMTPLGLPLEEAFRRLVQSGILFDQAILENANGKNWIHLSVAPIYRKPRREALTWNGSKWAVYSLPTTEESSA